MTIEALNIAANSLIKTQKQATRLAGDIIKTISANTSEPIGAKTGPTNLLVHQIVKFKQTEIQFHANATVFKKVADMSAQSIGIFVDKKS